LKHDCKEEKEAYRNHEEDCDGIEIVQEVEEIGIVKIVEIGKI
jgi:hypothetical protein